MSSRSDKVACALRWTLHSVDLCRPVGKRFQLSWTRGRSSSGQTEAKRPDANGLILYEQTVQITITVYVSKTDGSIRAKGLSLMLNRPFDSPNHRVQGRLNINIGPYYGMPHGAREWFRMESNGSVRPIVNATFTVATFRANTDGFETHQFCLEQQVPRLALSDSDQREKKKASAEKSQPVLTAQRPNRVISRSAEAPQPGI
jgi:hypothetical protein